jgi:hypothetical protein
MIARLVTTEAKCPALHTDASRLQMKERARPDELFPVLVCEALIPRKAKEARLGEHKLPLPTAQLDRIAILGDTGCRVKVGETHEVVQACNDPEAWPFAKVSSSVARSRPGLIVHLGDFHYRESPCPEGNDACKGSPHGYGWDAWNADFFEAARPLLLAAPWIFVRGNHESCNRAGEGWFRFFEPGPYRKCTDDTKPYLVKHGSAELVVMDSAIAHDMKVDPKGVELMRKHLKAISKMPLKKAWLLSHKPFWAPVVKDMKDPHSALDSFNHTLQAASGNRLPSAIKAIFAGHLHAFEELHFADGRPDQFVVGHSGSSLYPPPRQDPTGLEVAGARVRAGSTYDGFGYFMLNGGASGKWEGALHDAAGAELRRCPETEGRFYCEGGRR